MTLRYLWHVLTHRVPMLWRFHVVHHADIDLDASTATRRDTGSNWSGGLSWWGRLHGTFRRRGDAQAIGVPAYRDEAELTFSRLLAMPFRPQRSSFLLP